MDPVYQTLRFTTWASILIFSIYSISPIYIVQPAGDGIRRLLPHDTHGSTLANRTLSFPGIEEMNGDFHHHDPQGNDLIRIEKKSAVIEKGINPKLVFSFNFKPLSNSLNCDPFIARARRSGISTGFKHGGGKVLLSEITTHSPPVIPS